MSETYSIYCPKCDEKMLLASTNSRGWDGITNINDLLIFLSEHGRCVNYMKEERLLIVYDQDDITLGCDYFEPEDFYTKYNIEEDYVGYKDKAQENFKPGREKFMMTCDRCKAKTHSLWVSKNRPEFICYECKKKERKQLKENK